MKFPKRDTNEGGGLFFKLKDGESKTGVLRGEVYEFGVIWKDGKSTVTSIGTQGSKARYKLNIVVHEENKFVAKVWEFSQTVCNQLAALSEEYDMSITKIKISRKGTDLDTEYSIITTKDQLGAGHIKAIEQVPLNILDQTKKDIPNMAPQAPGFGSEPNWDSEDVPF